jgi:flagellar M-ring protein FliF
MAGPNEAIAQARQFWDTRSSRQKLLLLAGACATVLLVTLFVRLIGTADYKPISTGLEPAEAEALAAQLDADGIPHQTSPDGKTISVPSEKLAEARMKTAAQGAQHGGRMGFELFDKMSWGQTEFDQKVTYQRALEGELEKTIETLSDVESARVHLVMAKDSVFLDKEQPAKASVILKLRGKGLPKESAAAISRLVSGAVNELSPDDVSIIDADSARSLGTGHNGQDDSDGMEQNLTQRLISTLEPVVGTDKIRASVTVDQTQESTEESQEKYDPAVSAMLSDQTSVETASGSAIPAGVPGTSSNTPASGTKPGEPAMKQSAAQNQTQSPSQMSKTESAQYGVNKVVLHTILPAGRIQRVSAAILVDDMLVKTVQNGKTTYTRKKWSQPELDKIQGLAQAVIGFDAKRGDTVTVQNMSFDTDSIPADLPAPTLMDKGRKVVADYSSLLRPVSLLLLFMLAYFFIVRPVQKQVMSAAPAQLSAPAQAAALAGGAGINQLGGGYADRDDSAQEAAKLKDQMVGVIKQKPVNSTRAVQAWLREEQS